MEHCLGVWRQLDALEPVFTPMVWQRGQRHFKRKNCQRKGQLVAVCLLGAEEDAPLEGGMCSPALSTGLPQRSLRYVSF